jgi:hypothetical protein
MAITRRTGCCRACCERALVNAATNTKDEAIKLVRTAFAHVAYPGDDGIVETTPFRDLEREAIAVCLKGKHWRDLTYASLKAEYRGDCSAILWYLSRWGFHFYFPAFLLITLREHETADLTADTSIHAFRSSGKELSEWKAGRLDMFATDQLIAIRAAFQVLLAEQSETLRLKHGDDDVSLRDIMLGDIHEAIAEVSCRIESSG